MGSTGRVRAMTIRRRRQGGYAGRQLHQGGNMETSPEHANGTLPNGEAVAPEVTPLRRMPAPTATEPGASDGTPRADGSEPEPHDGHAALEESMRPRRAAQRRAAAPTASDFTSERLLRPTAEAP